MGWGAGEESELFVGDGRLNGECSVKALRCDAVKVCPHGNWPGRCRGARDGARAIRAGRHKAG
jgi:hypothetical protein